jgi:hypothetical protein
MAITAKDFAGAVGAISELLPYAKRPSVDAQLLLWTTPPVQVQQELSSHHLAYASAQLLLDPARPQELAIPVALLRYLYRLENGLPNFNWGLRPDLAQRMAGTGFQPLPSSQLELEAHGHAGHDGARHEPAGVLAQLAVLPELHPDRWGQGR